MAFVRADRFQLLLPMVADVEHKGGLGRVLEMHTVVVVNSLGVMRLAGHVGLAELRPKACGVDQSGFRQVIEVGVFPIGGK